MKKFKINKKNYTLKNNVNDIKLSDSIKISELNSPYTNEQLLMILNSEINFNKLSNKEIIYFKELIKILSNIKENIINELDSVSLLTLFEFIKVPLYMIYFQEFSEYKPQGLESINWKGKKYYFPNIVEFDGEFIYGFDINSKTVTEAGNLINNITKLKENGIKYLPTLCAIYLKENIDEKYNEKKILEKEKLFQDLPLSVALDIFFFIYNYSINYIVNSKLSLAMENQQSLINKIKGILIGFFQSLKRN